ncbi:MAG: undecaprenyl/decaprenyl-phosphate alpha-N-acetylglucosaminyl 1-phosphate transferase [Actinobacteria bacterium]|nr:undecaprenyl/decaprenyl-phosphate alpha-N-acetylglucosaminyl 1-phosphate transferase [Actinomycetota bacterium]
MADVTGYLIVGTVAIGATAVATPLVRALAEHKGWLAMPDARKVHTVATPDVGGLAMFVGFLAAFLVASQMDRFSPLFDGNSEPLGVVLAALVILLVGTRDDIKEVSAPARVLSTVVSALVLVYFGVTMFYFRVPFVGVLQLSDDWIPIVTVVWLLVMTQAVNLIDGLDGLAAGIVAIGSIAFFIYSRHLSGLGLLTEPNIGPLVAIIVVGICVGFLPYNFNRATIFMGDGGAYLLGLLVAVSTSVVGGRADPTTQAFNGQTYFFLAPVVIPLIILGVPVVDVLFAIIRRVSRRQSFATADKGHLHHRLIALGHGPRRAVAILWLWTAFFSGLVLYPVFNKSATNFAPFGLAALVLFLYTVLHPDLQRDSREQEPHHP